MLVVLLDSPFTIILTIILLIFFLRFALVFIFLLLLFIFCANLEMRLPRHTHPGTEYLRSNLIFDQIIVCDV
ncbi:hypothetical protein HN51_015874 [Arachis hypogaea]